MTISKSTILSFANRGLEGSYSGTELDIEIQEALDDLAQMHVLEGQDTSQALAAGTTYLSYPSTCLDSEQAIIDVTITDDDGLQQPPLVPLPGGWAEYANLMTHYNSTQRSTPGYYVVRNRRLYVYPVPSSAYTTSIRYYRRHQALASGIEFDDSWQQAIQYGTLYFFHLLAESQEGMAIWQPKYYEEKERRRLHIPRSPYIRNG